MNIEDTLRTALRPEDPGPDFTARVMERIGTSKRRPKQGQRLPLALAASVLVAAFGLVMLRQQVEQRRIQATQQQLRLALEITSEQLNQVQQRLVRNANEENGI
jgi:Tfp pilus assembly protein PilX